MRVSEFVDSINSGLKVLELKDIPDNAALPAFTKPLDPEVMFNTKGQRGWKAPAWTRQFASLDSKPVEGYKGGVIRMFTAEEPRFDGPEHGAGLPPILDAENKPRRGEGIRRCASELVDEAYAEWSALKAEAIANGANAVAWKQPPALWYRVDEDGNLTMLRFVGHGGFLKIGEAPQP